MSFCPAGWTSLITYDKKENLVATLLLNEILWKRQTAINQLMDGLRATDLLAIVKQHPEEFKEKFVFSDKKLTKARLLEQTHISVPTTQAEERTTEFFMQYLDKEDLIEIGNGM